MKLDIKDIFEGTGIVIEIVIISYWYQKKNTINQKYFVLIAKLFKIPEKSQKLWKHSKCFRNKKNRVRTFRRNSASSSQVHFVGNENYWLLGMFSNFSNDLIGQFKGPNVHNWVHNNNGIHITTGLDILEWKNQGYSLWFIFSQKCRLSIF